VLIIREVLIPAGMCALVSAALAGCGGTTQTTATVTSTVQPTITQTETVTYTPPPPPGPKTTIDSDGTYQVGVDIVPGNYHTTGSSGCYWARLSSLDTNDIIDNNNSNGPQVVGIQPTDKAFLTQRCGTWQKTD
jgi:hypothetical protein